MAYIIGHAPRSPCAVCGLSPVALEQVEGVPELATCARCALPYVIAGPDGAEFAEAVLSITPQFVNLFQRYYRETGRKIGLPGFMLGGATAQRLDPQTLERTRAMDDWLHEHEELVAAAAAPMTWPYASVTVEAVELDGEMVWSVLSPPGGLPMDPMIPFKVSGLPVGTIVTIQIPVAGPPQQLERDPEGEPS